MKFVYKSKKGRNQGITQCYNISEHFCYFLMIQFTFLHKEIIHFRDRQMIRADILFF